MRGGGLFTVEYLSSFSLFVAAGDNGIVLSSTEGNSGWITANRVTSLRLTYVSENYRSKKVFFAGDASALMEGIVS